MRLHQRVGRLNRYGQKRRVEVFTVRNPDTVESRIWDKLNGKIGQIMRALQEVMAEPEDLLQLVLGMASPGMFREVFAGATGVKPEAVGSWFDAKTSQFGGRDALAAVRDLVGHCARFDFRDVVPQIPRLDLPDLEPFFRLMLARNGRQVRADSGGLSFKTPDLWTDFPGARRDYAGLGFDRSGADPQKILGVGHRLVDRALDQACDEAEMVAILPNDLVPAPIYVFRICDRVTGYHGTLRALVVGVDAAATSWTLLRDWELILRLNSLMQSRDLRRGHRGLFTDAPTIRSEVDAVTRWLNDKLHDIDHQFRVPEVGLCCVLAPQKLNRE